MLDSIRKKQLKLLIKNYLKSNQGLTINMINNTIHITNNKRLNDNFIAFGEYSEDNIIIFKHYNSMRNIYGLRISKKEKIQEELFIILEKLILL